MPKSRTFGIEIEYAGDRYELERALSAANIPMNSGSYSNWMRSKWTSKEDGSVDNGGELASGVMDFYKTSDRQQVNEVLRVMREVGCATTEQAGIHVHVGTAGLSDDQIAQLAYGFMRFEDFAYRLAASGWPGMRGGSRTYAHPYYRSAKAEMVASKFNISSVREQARDRYNGLNLSPHFLSSREGGGGKQTAEFRIFNQTMNADRAQAFIAFAVGMVEAASMDRFRRPGLTKYNCFPLGGMLEGWRSEGSVYTTMMRTLSNKVLAPADRRAIAYFWRSSRPVASFGSDFHIPGWYGPETLRVKQVSTDLGA